MYFHLTNTQVITVSSALVLIIIFAVAVLLDKRWEAAGHHDLGSEKEANSFRQSSNRDDKDGSSDLYTRRADLVASGLGTAEQRITLRCERQHNLAGD